MSANGGIISYGTRNGVDYTIHTFTSNGTLSVQGSATMEYFLVGGGGGGGPGVCRSALGGGGGGGGVATGTFVPSTSDYNVTIGAGSVVINDIPDNTIVVGNPAKIIKIKEVDER